MDASFIVVLPMSRMHSVQQLDLGSSLIEGEVTCPVGFMSLHDDLVELNNLHVWHKFKNTLLLVQIR